MCVEGGFFFKINKRDSTFIREMRVIKVIEGKCVHQGLFDIKLGHLEGNLGRFVTINPHTRFSNYLKSKVLFSIGNMPYSTHLE